MPAWVLDQVDRQHPDHPQRVSHRKTDYQVTRALQDLRALTVPATAEEWAVLIDRLMAFSRAFGLNVGDTEIAVREYHNALHDVPYDLAGKAIDQLIRTWKWGNRIPLPADLRECLPAEHYKRLRALSLFEDEARERNLPCASKVLAVVKGFTTARRMP